MPLQYLGTQRAQLRKLVKPTGKLLWMSEFGCGSSPPSDMGAALELSAMILRVRACLTRLGRWLATDSVFDAHCSNQVISMQLCALSWMLQLIRLGLTPVEVSHQVLRASPAYKVSCPCRT